MLCGSVWSLLILGVAIRSALVSFQEMSAVTTFIKEQLSSAHMMESRTAFPVEQLEPIPEIEPQSSRSAGTLEQLVWKLNEDPGWPIAEDRLVNFGLRMFISSCFNLHYLWFDNWMIEDHLHKDLLQLFSSANS